jgi:dihydroorotase
MVRKNKISLGRMVQLLSEKPAELFNLRDRGSLAQGKNADLVVIDFKRKFRINASKFHSKAKFSPFDGWQVQGCPVKTYVNGLPIMDDMEIVAKAGSGKIIQGDHA